MTRARELSKLSVFSVDTDNNVGVGSETPDAKLDVVGVVSATEYYGDGSKLTNISGGGATLAASSGTQRLVVTSLTSGGMTAAATNADLTYATSTNTLSATQFSGTLLGNATGLQGTPNISVGNIAGTPTFTEDAQFNAEIDVADDKVLNFGAGDDGRISYISSNNTFNVRTPGGSADLILGAGTAIRITSANGLTDRARFSSSGLIVTGIVTASSYRGDGSLLTGISAGMSTEASTPSNTTVTLDLSNQDHKITATGICTITVSGGTEGDSHTVRIINSGISTIGFSEYFLWPSGSSPVLPTGDGDISLISFTVNRVGAGGTQLLAGASLNFS